mgnify:CR=1 FL=1
MNTAAEADILLVDDELEVLQGIGRNLRRAAPGWRLAYAGSAHEALMKMGERGFDLVLSDVLMPGQNGMHLLQELQEAYPATPVVLMTGAPKVDAAVDALRLGAFDYLCKPVSVEKLQEVITNALASAAEARRSMTTATTPVVRPSINHYRVLRTLGEGSMGTVLLVEDMRGPEPRPQLALKALKVGDMGASERDEVEQRFLREAEIASRFDHPNIASVTDYGIDEKTDVPYFVMEYIHGQSLRRVMDQERQRSLPEKAHILAQVAEALVPIHREVTCHRDIKPGNIIVDHELKATLIDFGIVKLPKSDLTQFGFMVGTPAYLSPELIDEQVRVDHRSDLFSLGIVAYELCIGHKPFEGDNLVRLARSIQKAQPAPPSACRPMFPAELERIIFRLLARDPDHRQTSAAEVAREFHRFAAGPGTPPPTTPDRKSVV